MEQEHDETETKTERPIGWPALITTSSVIVAMLGGALIFARADMGKQLTEFGYSQQDALQKMNAKLSAVEGKINAAPAQPAADTQTLEALKVELEDAKKNITQLQEMVGGLEKKLAATPVSTAQHKMPETPAVEPAKLPVTPALKQVVLSGEPFAPLLVDWSKSHPNTVASLDALRVFAHTGLPREAALREALRAIATAPTTLDNGFAKESIAGKLNTHFGTFISVRKKDPSTVVLTELIAAIDRETLAQLEARVQNLPPERIADYANWLEQCAKRRAALSALETIEGAL